MSWIRYSTELEGEYLRLFDTAQIIPSRRSVVDSTVDRIVANKPRYEEVVRGTKIPWGLVGAIHNMETSLRFDQHLHNGDPLTARTRHVPANRPPKSVGDPPFTWEESAYDALFRHKKWETFDWSKPAQAFYQAERYNGWGYRLYHPNVLSPYLWSFTNHYVSGKYAADGVWDEKLVSKQVGVSAILRRLLELGEFTFSELSPVEVSVKFPIQLQEAPVLGGELVQKYLNRFPGIDLEENGILGPLTSQAFYIVHGRFLLGDDQANDWLEEILAMLRIDSALPIKYAEEKTQYGALLQDHLNQFPGIFLRVDSWPGPKTAEAFFKVYGVPLLGDPDR